MTSFTAQVADWVLETEQRLEAVFKSSAQDVFETMLTPVAKGGNLPVDTGFLRNSFVSGLNGATALTPPDDVAFVIAGASLDDVIFGGFHAKYARHVEYGTQGRAGRRYVGLAAAQWQTIVDANVTRLKQQIG